MCAGVGPMKLISMSVFLEDRTMIEVEIRVSRDSRTIQVTSSSHVAFSFLFGWDEVGGADLICHDGMQM